MIPRQKLPVLFPKVKDFQILILSTFFYYYIDASKHFTRTKVHFQKKIWSLGREKDQTSPKH